MGKYKLSNIRIRFAINKNEYMTAKIKDIFTGKEDDFITFNKNQINIIKPYLPITQGGTANPFKEIPEQYTLIDGGYYEYYPVQKFFRKHTKGELRGKYYRNPDGKVQIFEKLIVFCQYYIENGKRNFPHKESPTEIGQREFSYSCIPYTKEKEIELNQRLNANINDDASFQIWENDYENASTYYDDGLDMDQQSEDYYKELGIF
nr:hypothetical protein [uncultured Bacteroides sp.]